MSSQNIKVSFYDLTDYSNLISDDIFTLMGFTNLEEKKKQELMQKMIETINARVINRLAKTIGEERMLQFIGFVEKDDKEGAKKFLLSEDIDLDKMLAQEALAYKLEMTKGAQAIKQTMIKEEGK